ncbi:Lipase, GDSL [Corchorus olitorius]|uniref:Lipase, GDSL n=1 Tax=Corchorus olitorius TaxID=93759 RepID=A0A1R3I082_9ROSI|nr:Lipase, GDSL [Corchorus olitorius]
MVGPPRPQFVLFGSSIVQQSFSNGGWGAILADVYARKADILVRGYFGWNSRRALEVLDHVFPKDAAVQPSLIITYFGGNDSMGPHPSGLGPHVPLPEYIENMRKIVIHLKKYAEACVQLCQELDVKVVNLVTAFQKRDNWTTDYFTDGIHLSAEGSKIVVAEILKVLKEAEWQPSLHWKNMPTEFPEDSPYDLVAADGKTTLNGSDWTFHRSIRWD